MTPSVGVVKLGGHTQISRGMMVMVIEAAYANGTGVANALHFLNQIFYDHILDKRSEGQPY